MNAEQDKQIPDEPKRDKDKTVKEEEQLIIEPEKKPTEERNNSKRTGMPFGFDKLFFRFKSKIIK